MSGAQRDDTQGAPILLWIVVIVGILVLLLGFVAFWLLPAGIVADPGASQPAAPPPVETGR